MIVGLPYANLGSPELVERMKYVKSLEEARGDLFVREKGVKDAGAELYENMCMNAVNQSIGGLSLFFCHSHHHDFIVAFLEFDRQSYQTWT